MTRLNKVNYLRHPRDIPDTDEGNFRLYYELELLRSVYETEKLNKQLQHYTQIIDVLGERGLYVPFNSDLEIDKALRKYDWYDMISKPIPTPGKNESQDDFIGRCMSALADSDPNRPQKQRLAMCFSVYRRRKK